jgi:hypothetical protein
MYETRVEYGTTFDMDWSADIIYRGKEIFTCTGQTEEEVMDTIEDWLNYHEDAGFEGIIHVVVYEPTSAQ